MTVKIKFLFVFSLLAVLSCKKKKDEAPKTIEMETIRIEVSPKFGVSALHLDSVYQTPEGYDVKFTDIIFYVTSLKNGNSVLSNAALFDLRATGNLLLETNANHANFNQIQGFLGVESTLNHADPSAFPTNSPLNIMNANTMHWGWNPGYIFFKIEAKLDTINDGNPLFDHQIAFHVGTDNAIQNMASSNLTWSLSGGKYVNTWTLDMLTFLNNGVQSIDLKTENFTHSGTGSEVLTQKVSDMFKSALQMN